MSERLREYFYQRVNPALGRYSIHIRSLRASLEDASNPSVGPQRSCSLELDGDFGKRVIVVHDRSFESAIDCSLAVCSEVIERALSRANSEMFAIVTQNKLAS